MRCLLFLLIVMLGTASAQQTAFRKEIYASHGDTVLYRLLYPLNFSYGKQYPLVVFLHGSGARGNDNESQLRYIPEIFTDSVSRTKFPCFLLVPQCPKNDAWSDFPGFPQLYTRDTPTRVTRLTLELIRRFAKADNIDDKRIYITGLSLGGEGTIDMMIRRPDLFAAAVPLCPVADTSKAALISHIPVWFFHGDSDQVNHVNHSRWMVAALRKAGGSPRYTEYAGVGHKCWPGAYSEPDLLPWLFSQKRKKKK